MGLRELGDRLQDERRQSGVRYKVYVPVPDLAGNDVGNCLRFTAYGPAMPRVGESLHFDVAPQGLALSVFEVAHWFSPADVADPCETVVSANLRPGSDSTARELLAPDVFRRWLARFPYLEFDEDPIGCHSTAEDPRFGRCEPLPDTVSAAARRRFADIGVAAAAGLQGDVVGHGGD
jgi:hypothetical protein